MLGIDVNSGSWSTSIGTEFGLC